MPNPYGILDYDQIIRDFEDPTVGRIFEVDLEGNPIDDVAMILGGKLVDRGWDLRFFLREHEERLFIIKIGESYVRPEFTELADMWAKDASARMSEHSTEQLSEEEIRRLLMQDD
ncbi:MAG TPA: hypothetical protein VH593_14045 [Ktedonobacteraceae bacterium]